MTFLYLQDAPDIGRNIKIPASLRTNIRDSRSSKPVKLNRWHHRNIVMPYIRQDKRDEFDTELDAFIIKFLETGDTESTAGRLNYAVSRILGSILNDDERISYSRINELIGVLECAKIELYRRIAAPYEDDKSRINGDVYFG